MMVAEVAVHSHGQGSTILVSEPAADCGNVDAGFNAGGGEEVAQVVVGDPWDFQQLEGAIHGFLALLNLHHRLRQGLFRAFVS